MNGLPVIQLAVIFGTTDPAVPVEGAPKTEGKTGNYGYIVSNVRTNVDGDYIYTIWNGSEKVTVTDTTGTNTQLKKGTVISFTDLGSNKIDDVTRVGKKAEITGFSDSFVKINTAGVTGVTVDTDDKTEYFYINSHDVYGNEGGKLYVAPAGVQNALVLYETEDSTNTAKLIVVDVTGDGLSQDFINANP